MKITPTNVSSLRAIPKQFGNRLKDTGIIVEIGQVQKTLLLETAGILRKVLNILGCWLWFDIKRVFQFSFTVC